jgi:membrane protease YdiL (CAAX protease family)
MSVPSSGVERVRVGLFLGLAFGISWAVAAAIYATGGLVDSPELVAGVTLATVLLPTGYMFGPAIANLLTRLVTGEGWAKLHLRPHGDRWRLYVAAWLGPAALVLAGGAVFFAAFPQYFDPTMAGFESAVRAAAEAAGGALTLDVRTLVAVQLVAALTIGPLINTVFAFGEEFGWRAYLLPKLLPLGARRATVLVGVVWGVWHWPLVAMGYNYGFGYAGAPWTGLVAMCWFTVLVGVFLSWVTLREGSVWPAALGHGAVNAVAAIAVVFVQGSPSPLLGPTPLGVVASLPWLVLAAWLLYDSDGVGSPRPPFAAPGEPDGVNSGAGPGPSD